MIISSQRGKRSKVKGREIRRENCARGRRKGRNVFPFFLLAQKEYQNISGAPRAKRACGAPWVNKSTHPRKFGNHVTERPSVRTTGIPMFSLTLSSYFGSPGESSLHINWQLSKQGIRDQHHLAVSRAQVSTHRGRVFFELICWQFTRFQMIAGSRLLFLKFISNMLCLCQYCTALLRFWSQTDLRRKNSASFLNAGGEDLFLSLSRVGHAPRPIFMLWEVKIWQVSSCVNFMQHLESCLLWQLKLTEFWVNLWCINCLFPLDVQKEIQLLSRVFSYSWLVCLLGFWLRNASLVKADNAISGGIVFVFHLAGCVREL